MTALIGFVIGVCFVVVCVAFVVTVNAAAQAVSDYADRKAAERDAASTFCADFIPQVEDVAAKLDALPDLRQS